MFPHPKQARFSSPKLAHDPDKLFGLGVFSPEGIFIRGYPCEESDFALVDLTPIKSRIIYVTL